MDNTVYIKDGFVERVTIILVSFFLVMGVIFVLAENEMLSAMFFTIPIAIILLSSTRLTVYLYVFCIYISWRLVQNPPLLISDITALLLIASFVINFLLRYKTSLAFPSIYKYYLALFLALIITSFFSYNYIYAVTPLLRVLVQLTIVVILYNAINIDIAQRLIKFYFWVAVIHSVYNLIFFFKGGGHVRLFGFAGPYFDDLTMLAWPIGLAFFIWSKSRRQAYIYGAGLMLTMLGILATQSRAPIVTPFWVGLIIVIFSAYRAKKMGQFFALRRLKFLFLMVIIAGLLLAFSGVLENIVRRFQELPEIYSGTVWLRMSLWRTSLDAFRENPITGVGPGSFRYIESIYPILRFDAARLYLEEASAHNLFLHYLAETGLIGTFALLSLFFKNLWTSMKLTKHSVSENQTAISVGLLGAGLAIFGSIFYMDGWMWGQNAHAAPLFIAITAKLACNNRHE